MPTQWTRLAALRAAKGLSQYDLARELQMSRSTLANYEQGTREPDHETTRRIANYFGVSVDSLLDNPHQATDTDPAAVPPEWQEVLAKVRHKGYSPDQVLQALRILDSLKKELDKN